MPTGDGDFRFVHLDDGGLDRDRGPGIVDGTEPGQVSFQIGEGVPQLEEPHTTRGVGISREGVLAASGLATGAEDLLLF